MEVEVTGYIGFSVCSGGLDYVLLYIVLMWPVL